MRTHLTRKNLRAGFWIEAIRRSRRANQFAALAENQKFITGASSTDGVAVDGFHVYWSDFIGGVYAIGRAKLDGSHRNQRFITGGNITHAVAVDGSYIYWTNDGLHSIGRAKRRRTDRADWDQGARSS